MRSRTAAPIARDASDPAEVITIVSGLPRSGTSLMMQMLRAAGAPVLADDHRPADDDNPRGYLEYAPVKSLRRDASWLAEARGRALKVVAPLLRDLPDGYDYRVVWMGRDLDEVLTSQQHMLERQGRVEHGAELGDDALLRRGFERQLERARGELARRSIPVLELAYARAIADPAGVAREVCAFLGGGLDAAAAASVVDPSLYRQRGL